MKISATRRAVLAGVAFAAVLATGTFAADKPTMGIVVKIGGIPWFNAMETGIKEEGAKDGVDAYMIWPTSADPALQVRAIEDLIAKKVNVIGVVPNDEKALEPVLEKALQAGIKVVTHEGPGIKNKDWDFEFTSSKSFGEAHAEALAAKAMGGKGEYAVFVGSLTVPLHNAWADAAIAYLKVHYPDMKPVGDRYARRRERRRQPQDRARPHGRPSRSARFPCVRQPVADRRRPRDRREGRHRKSVRGRPALARAGTQADQGRRHPGRVHVNPAEAGRVFVRVGKLLATGQEIKDGMTIEGLGVVHPDPKTHNIITDNLLPINKDLVDKLAGLGL